MILSLFVAGAVLCGGFEVWKCDFHGRRSTLCALDVWTKFSWQAQGIVRLRVVVEVNVAVTLGLACARVLFGGAGIAKLLGRAA